MSSGEINKRTLILDAEWVSPEDSEPSEDEDEDEEVVDFYENDGDDEDEDEEGEEDEEDEEESEVELPPIPSKRKRPAAPSKKRVTFDLKKPAKGAGPRSGGTPRNPNAKKRKLALKK